MSNFSSGETFYVKWHFKTDQGIQNLTVQEADRLADRPEWLVSVGVLGVGLTLPVPYLLARPAVYEASILGGQAFLMAGLWAMTRGAAPADGSGAAGSSDDGAGGFRQWLAAPPGCPALVRVRAGRSRPGGGKPGERG